jgi:hypothetical protein
MVELELDVEKTEKKKLRRLLSDILHEPLRRPRLMMPVLSNVLIRIRPSPEGMGRYPRDKTVRKDAMGMNHTV